MELKESIARKTIYGFSITYKSLLVMGVLLFLSSIIMSFVTLLEADSTSYNELISDAALGYLFVTSVSLIFTGFTFRMLRETVRNKTRSFRRRRSRI